MSVINRAESLIADFAESIQYDWYPNDALYSDLVKFLELLGPIDLVSIEDRHGYLLEIIADKLAINDKQYKTLLDTAAEHKILFHYHEKLEIMHFFNARDTEGFLCWLKQKEYDNSSYASISSSFKVPLVEDVLSSLHAEIQNDPQSSAILSSVFGAYIYRSFNESIIQPRLNDDCQKRYFPDFWQHLQSHYGSTLARHVGLIVIHVNQQSSLHCSIEDLTNMLLELIRKAYLELSNHCYLSVVIDAVSENPKLWEMIADLVIFAEKFIEEELETGYFRKQQIQNDTQSHIGNLDTNSVRFDLANDGFTYKDCLIVSESEHEDRYACVLLFEKNKRDETLIPCPACRSQDVRGNSYPVLGVRSWECQNQFCPDRSKYNRGKRYSLASLVKQQAILDPHNHIPKEHLSQWRRDIATVIGYSDIVDMLIRYYSLFGDTVIHYGELEFEKYLGRAINLRTIEETSSSENVRGDFYSYHYFKRYKISKSHRESMAEYPNLSNIDNVTVFCGDTFDVLHTLPTSSVDGVVTSPPYYNAKSYAAWPNVYCYLYDMLNIAREIFRVLKSGAPFLLNIFDYFDNENNIVFSAMGKKRMILGYYIINMFTELGFEFQSNIPWDKGEIEGKRNFNQGNFSPYYQSPHNCWEHMLVFSKSEANFALDSLPTILRAKPVLKMFNGENRLGHSAPFPEEIPLLLFSLIGEKDAVVLDPFSGSMTTGRCAYHKGYSSINIDYKAEYCHLGLRLLHEAINQPKMRKLL